MLAGPQKVETVDDWPEPECGPNDVIVEMHGVGICGSDLAIYDGHHVPPDFPWVMGHEGAGEIIETGRAVADRHIGQRVVIEPNYCCFDCPACRSGATSACDQRTAVGMNAPGLLAERVAVPARFTWPVSDEAATEDLVCTEPVAVARTAVHRSGVGPEDTCLVIGAGSQGLFVCMVLLAMGACPFVVEPRAERRKLAERIGAGMANADQGEFRYVFETSGATSALRTALYRAAPMAQVMLIGIGYDDSPVSSVELVRRQLLVRGSLIYDHPHDFRQAVAEVSAQRLRPSWVVAARYPLDKTADAFAATRDVPGKTWISFAPGKLR